MNYNGHIFLIINIKIMSFHNHDEDANKRYGKRESLPTKNPQTLEIDNLTKDKLFGLPMQELFIKENYDQKKERFSKTEDFLTILISETNNEKLTHTFLRWKELRNQLNQMYVENLEKIALESGNKLNTNL